MDTKSRILAASLALFNEEGEDTQAAIDIANVLDISPGNLYYHFKGKDAIIRALFDAFEEEMELILDGMSERVTTLEDAWISVHILFEEIWDMRFLFDNLGALRRRYADLDRKFDRLVARIRQTLLDILHTLKTTGALDVEARHLPGLVEQMLYRLIFWRQHVPTPVASPAEARALREDATAQVMGILAPFLSGSAAE